MQTACDPGMLIDMDKLELLRISRGRESAVRHSAEGTGRALREAYGLSIGEIASVVGVTKPTIWRWESGKHRPRGEAGARWGELIDDLERRASKLAAA